MNDLHRRDVLPRFLPAIRGLDPVSRDAYVRRPALLTLPGAELVRALRRSPERDDPDALRVLGSLTPARSIRP